MTDESKWFCYSRNLSNVDLMKNAVLAIQHYIVRSEEAPLDEQHRHYSKGAGAWCMYWHDKEDSGRKRLPAVLGIGQTVHFERSELNF